jgi:hypothetical protein
MHIKNLNSWPTMALMLLRLWATYGQKWSVIALFYLTDLFWLIRRRDFFATIHVSDSWSCESSQGESIWF